MKRWMTLAVVLLMGLGMIGCDANAVPIDQTETAPTVTDENAPSKEQTITIYQISLKAFDAFMNERVAFATREDNEIYTFPEKEELYFKEDRYFKYNGGIMKVYKRLISFVNEGVAEYLHDHGVGGEIVDRVVYETSCSPLTIWVKTTEGEAFVTVNELLKDEDYTYRFYTVEEYEKRFKRRQAELYVLGQPIVSDGTVWMNEYESILPMMAVMKACGAVVTPQSNEQFLVEHAGKQWVLNMEEKTFCENAEVSYDLLFLDGGVTITYEENGEMMINDDLAVVLLSDMGYSVDVRHDTTENTVQIVERS